MTEDVLYAIVKHEGCHRRVYAGYLTADAAEAHRIRATVEHDHPGVFKVARLTYVTEGDSE